MPTTSGLTSTAAWYTSKNGNGPRPRACWPRPGGRHRRTWRERFRSDTVYALYKAGRSRDAYAQIGPHAVVFGQLAHWLLMDKNATELLALIDLHRPNAGDDTELPLLEARARIVLKQPAQAIKLWQDAYRRAPAVWKRRQIITTFVFEMHAAKHGLDAYRAAPDRRAAFESLASGVGTGQGRRRAGQPAARARPRPRERCLAALLPRRARAAARPARAWRTGTSRQRGAAVPSQRWTFRRGLNRAWVRSGRAVAAYHAAGRTPSTFRDLASVCLEEKNAAQLKALVAAHRATDPDEPGLLAWELQAIWLSGDHAAVLAHLDAHADAYARQPARGTRARTTACAASSS